MNKLLQSLAEACRDNRMSEKLLVVPSPAAGHQLCEALAGEGFSWFNLRSVTPIDLALEVAHTELAYEEMQILTEGQALCLLEEIVSHMAQNGELTYFAAIQRSGSLARILYGVIQELRMAGLTALGLDPTRFVSLQKGTELKKMLCLYEQKMRREGFADEARIYRTAIQFLRSGLTPFKKAIFLIPEQMEMPPLAFAFIRQLTSGKRIVLPGEPVHNLDRPTGFYFPAPHSPAAEAPLSWLYRCEDAPPATGIEIFQAYGAPNEVKEVFRRLRQERIPLDHAVLCHTSADKYIPLAYTLACRLDIPVTFAEGVPLAFTRPGRLAMNLLRWLDENYTSALFYRILIGGDVSEPHAVTLARLLRRARVGWGRERYLPALETLAADLTRDAVRAEQRGDDGQAAYLNRLQSHALRLKELLAGVLAQIFSPDEDGLIDLQQLAAGISNVLTDLVRIGGELDGQALEAVRSGFTETAQSYPGPIPQKDALEQLRLRLHATSIGASGPQPGHLHVAGYQQAGYQLRHHTFVVGLDTSGFPGSDLQDPVLLDGERQVLCRRLSLRRDVPSRNLHTMARLLASRRGKVVLSFPCCDVTDGRPSSPAALLLQVFRLLNGLPDADYSAMLQRIGPAACYIPNTPSLALAEEEWWFARVLQGGLAGNPQHVAACYPGIAAGLQAAEARCSRSFTAYDGKAAVDPSKLDPRLNHRLILSATELEKLAACPFAYFLSYVLRVRPPDELVFDPSSWLDPMARGSLLHDIYCQYLRQAYPPEGPPRPDRDIMLAVADRLIAGKKEEIPPPSDVVYEYERGELLRGLEVFWRVEQESSGTPVFFEVPFGLGNRDIAKAGLSLAGPVEISLPGGGAIRLRGRIDRIDRAGDHLYQVWDFKTGGTYGYSDRGILRQGRQVQHALYSYAAECILRDTATDPQAKVLDAGYIFPTEKGEGQRFARHRAGRENALAAVAGMLDLVAAGLFCASHDSERCTFCDYAFVCRRPAMSEKMNEMIEHPQLVSWKELQSYE